MQISEQERQRRRRVVDEARHSSEMEGGRSTDDFRELQEAYVRGEMGERELAEATLRLARVKVGKGA